MPINARDIVKVRPKAEIIDVTKELSEIDELLKVPWQSYELWDDPKMGNYAGRSYDVTALNRAQRNAIRSCWLESCGTRPAVS